MSSHAHVILELPAPKEVSHIWDLNLSASFSSLDVPHFTRSRERQSATNTPPYRCCPGFSFSRQLLAIPLYQYVALVRRSSPCSKQVPILILPTVRYLMAPWAWAAHRGCLIAAIRRTGQNFQCIALLLYNSSSRLCARSHTLRENVLPGFKKCLPPRW